ncbi:hypothetical protein [Rhizobium leucaenae]|uniref:Uncharacterized protein n=1 Tax=Rhizobium leucaenae TaxID=29450 RepID=A0A7W7EKP3_9HYPH|nr:hypothetical protein [Rhizobium leucaenae]MBB4568709.1 hypothetical protein [Rhizobium leucaenae]MBB6302212.1 hypothetical protein [Rhizobium leucaenae]
MKLRSVFGTTMVALVLAVAPAGGAAVGLTGLAYAKGGNGNGNGGAGGGNGGGNGNSNGNGNGNSASHGSANSSHAKSDDADSSDADVDADTDADVGHGKQATHVSKSAAADEKLEKHGVTKTKTQAAALGSLNSLKRNYHAYMNSKDPKMAAIRAYVMDYAEFELKNGTNAVPTDPALSDEALRSALAQESKTGVVTDKTLAEAKDILGVGPAVGKIDQVRDALERSTVAPTDDTTDTAD